MPSVRFSSSGKEVSLSTAIVWCHEEIFGSNIYAKNLYFASHTPSDNVSGITQNLNITNEKLIEKSVTSNWSIDSEWPFLSITQYDPEQFYCVTNCSTLLTCITILCHMVISTWILNLVNGPQRLSWEALPNYIQYISKRRPRDNMPSSNCRTRSLAFNITVINLFMDFTIQ